MKSEFIKTSWDDNSIIGDCVKTQSPETFLEMEEYIIDKCREYKLKPSYNINSVEAGIPHPKDTDTNIKDPKPYYITYSDVMGGLYIRTGNCELNSRHLQYQTRASFDIEFPIFDKYKSKPTGIVEDYIIFLPGSNMIDVVDLDKCEEICIDYNAKLKLHPVFTEDGLSIIKKELPYDYIDIKSSANELLMGCKTAWVTMSSEIGMVATLMDIDIGFVSLWGLSYKCAYAPIYRLFKYKDLGYNKSVLNGLLSSKESGIVFPWQDDWKHRIDCYFKKITSY